MRYRYKNLKTGATIETNSRIHGDNWQPEVACDTESKEEPTLPEPEETEKEKVAPVQQRKRK